MAYFLKHYQEITVSIADDIKLAIYEATKANDQQPELADKIIAWLKNTEEKLKDNDVEDQETIAMIYSSIEIGDLSNDIED